MPNINSLNSLLRKVVTTDDLVKAYTKVDKRLTELQFGDTARNNLNYCSGAAWFVIQYLGGKDLYSEIIKAKNAVRLNSANVEDRLKDILKLSGPYIGYLAAKDNNAGSHECTFVRNGNQWAFYQANQTNGDENFTLAPALNNGRKNWCFNDMSESQFKSFFKGLTTLALGKKFFPYDTPPLIWDLAVFSLETKPKQLLFDKPVKAVRR